MKAPLRLIAALACLAPLPAVAQYNSPPGYTFGGMFPDMFGNNGYGYGAPLPQPFIPPGQSPFLTMPAPQYPFANPQFPGAPAGQTAPSGQTPATPAMPFPAAPMAQPSPYWMQTPSSPPRFITDVPTNVTPQTATPGYSVYTTPGFTPGPPRWAPLPGQGPAQIQSHARANTWATTPGGGRAAPAIPATPPKWPTP